MNIEVAIVIDGEAVKPNSDLQGLLDNLVGSYIKQNFLMARTGQVVRAYKVKDPNAPKREARPKMSPEETERVVQMATTLQHLTLSKTAITIAKALNRSQNTIYTRLVNLQKAGTLKFAPPQYSGRWAHRNDEKPIENIS